MRNPHRVSPSAIRTFMECPRKRLFRDLDRIPQDPMPWLESGTRMHAHLEEAKKTGKTPSQIDPEARVASAAIQYWPEGVEWEPEASISIKRPWGELFGYSDQLGSVGFVGDYKFTGNLKNLPHPEKTPFWWHKPFSPGRMKDEKRAALAAQVLKNDVQWVCYAYATGAPTVKGRWTYVVKPPKMEGNPRVIPVDIPEENRESLEEKLKVFDVAAADLVRMRRTLKSANEAPHNAESACGGLGINCQYSDICERKKLMANKTIAEIIAEAEAAKGGAPKVEAPAPEPEAETPAPETSTALESVMAEVNGEKAPKVNPPESKDVDTSATVDQVVENPGKRKKKAAKKTAKKAEAKKTEAPAPVVEAPAEEAICTGTIVAASLDGIIEIGETGSIVVPVGARVKVVLL